MSAPGTARPRPGLARARDDHRALFRRAMADTGHTQDSVGAALGVRREVVKAILAGQKRLHGDHLEALAQDPSTLHLARRYVQLCAEHLGWCVTETRPDGLCHEARRRRLVTELTDVLRTDGADDREIDEAIQALCEARAERRRLREVG